jgi:hypothetical protein
MISANPLESGQDEDCPKKALLAKFSGTIWGRSLGQDIFLSGAGSL